jgi:hypothetical protein
MVDASIELGHANAHGAVHPVAVAPVIAEFVSIGTLEPEQRALRARRGASALEKFALAA